MDKYASKVRTPDENQEFLEAHPELLHEHCMGAPSLCRAMLSALYRLEALLLRAGCVLAARSRRQRRR
jgi:hypothetical protein